MSKCECGGNSVEYSRGEFMCDKCNRAIFSCDICNDSGYVTVDGWAKKCNCLIEKINQKKIDENKAVCKTVSERCGGYFFEKSPNYQKNKVAIEQLKKFNVLYKRVYMWGGVGVGKTGLALSFIREKLNEGINCHFVRFTDLCGSFSFRWNSDKIGEAAREIITACNVSRFLIIDDLGTQEQTEKQLDGFSQFLDDYTGRMIITSNHPIEPYEYFLNGKKYVAQFPYNQDNRLTSRLKNVRDGFLELEILGDDGRK